MLIIQVRINCEDHIGASLYLLPQGPHQNRPWRLFLPTTWEVLLVLQLSLASSNSSSVLTSRIVTSCILASCIVTSCIVASRIVASGVSSSNSSSVVTSRIHGSHRLSRLHINVGYKMEKVKISFPIFELLEGVMRYSV